MDYTPPPPEIPVAIHEEVVKGTGVTKACFEELSDVFNVPKPFAMAYLLTERGAPGEYVSNTNGSRDGGPMQVNEINWPELQNKFGIHPEDLVKDPCLNFGAGLYFVRSHIDLALEQDRIKTWDDLFHVLARYNSKTKSVNLNYQEKFIPNLLTAMEVYSFE